MDDKLQQSLERLKESKEILKQFETKEEAIEFLVKETGISKDECSNAYDILMEIDLDKNINIK